MMEDDKSLISVIIPVYNGEKYLASCVESIKEQTYSNLEIIIINDGSTDKTGQVCHALQQKYDNIQVIALQDEGVSAARNAGIEAAKGECLTFVDADDRLHPDMLEILYDCIVTNQCDVAGCGFFIWKGEDDWKNFAGENWKPEQTERTVLSDVRIYTPDGYIKEAILQGNSRCWSKLYRKEAVKGTRFRTQLSIGEDMLFLVDMLACVQKIAEIPYQGYGYFQNPNGAIGRKFTPVYMDQITCWELVRNAVADRKAEHELYVQATTHLIMGVMLTAGKIAALPYRERRAYGEYVAICRRKLKEAFSVAGAYGGLSAGYKVKTKLFVRMPDLYIWLYHVRTIGGRR
ncbi:MAG: glycosyltransferase [Bacillus sp. (in: Bacteria)]|nr:glycosyltransferase [Bacillus sp. (in: firmicutes)]MCM1425481.1 glycosyltransferase [Eubacterium sp.]